MAEMLSSGAAFTDSLILILSLNNNAGRRTSLPDGVQAGGLQESAFQVGIAQVSTMQFG